MCDRYKSGDRVFAKMKGYPPWPARVKERLSVKAETYKLYFYGTYEAASIKVDQIFDYNEENITKYGKQIKKMRFPEAMQEIADNIEISDEHDKDLEIMTPAELNQSIPFVEQKDSDDDKEGELLIDEGPPPPVLKKESKPTNPTPGPMPKMIPAPPPRMTPAPTQKGNTGSIQKGNLIAAPIPKVIPAPTPKLTPTLQVKSVETLEPIPVKQTRRGSKSISKKDLPGGSVTPQPTIVAAETTSQPEMVSRSGRKIKPKRFADDELPISAAATAKGTSGDESKGSPDAPPAAKRTRRTGSINVAAAVNAKASSKSTGLAPAVPVPTLTEKPKVSAPVAMTNTRGRTRLSSELSIPPRAKSPPSPTLKAKPNEPLPKRIIQSNLARARSHKAGHSIIPVVKPEEVAKPSSAPVTKNQPNRTTPSQEFETEASVESEPVEGTSPILENEVVLGLSLPREDDAEDKENSLSAEEAQWLQNGEGGADSGEGEEVEVDEDQSGPEDPLEPTQIQKIPIMAKNGIDLEISYDEDRPEEFETQQAGVEWDLATARNVLKVRSELEKSEFAATNFLAELARAVDCKDDELKDHISHKTKEKALKKIHQLRMEGEMIEIIGEIVGCLTIKACDCDRALELLERLAGHTLNKLLLKKHPEVAQTINKLRRYVGDPDTWNYNEAQREDLKIKTNMIRTRAGAIYLNFKTLFCVDPDKPFMKIFRQNVEQFNESVSHLPLKSVLSLVIDPNDQNGDLTKKLEGNKTKGKLEEQGESDMDSIKLLECSKTVEVLSDSLVEAEGVTVTPQLLEKSVSISEQE